MMSIQPVEYQNPRQMESAFRAAFTLILKTYCIFVAKYRISYMDQLPYLPIGQQYFAKVRRPNAIYVDKTEYIFRLCSDEGYYFLSRPRRFGKSLTLDTIHELFNGHRELFRGLWIEDKWDWTQTHPVIRLSLDAIGYKEDGLIPSLRSALRDIARQFGVQLSKKSPGSLLAELIKALVEKTGKQVVILIDEYDKPIVDYLDPYDLTKATEQRDLLKAFFSVLKDTSRYIRLLFITGVSKFAKVSIFSDLNHLVDLTLHPNYTTLCGYTQAELEHSFEPYLRTMPADTLDNMKKWYDGYSWDGENFVYNPFSVLNFFDQKIFGNFWFATGTPTFLVRLMRKRYEYKLEETVASNVVLESLILEKFDDLDVNSLLLQTGYLTIKTVNDDETFTLDYPNQEVRNAFAQFLLSEYAHTSPSVPHSANIMSALRKNDVKRAIEIIHNLIQAVPDHNYIHHQEKFFHALVHLIFTIIGADARSELHTPAGRMDTAVLTSDRIFIFEFKLNETAEEALQCIRDRHYVDALRHHNKPITAVGVSFSTQAKGVAGWKMEEY